MKFPEKSIESFISFNEEVTEYMLAVKLNRVVALYKFVSAK